MVDVYNLALVVFENGAPMLVSPCEKCGTAGRVALPMAGWERNLFPLTPTCYFNQRSARTPIHLVSTRHIAFILSCSRCFQLDKYSKSVFYLTANKQAGQMSAL